MKSKRKNIFKRVISIMLVFSLNFALGISGRREYGPRLMQEQLVST